jgi:hypothetical protein
VEATSTGFAVPRDEIRKQLGIDPEAGNRSLALRFGVAEGTVPNLRSAMEASGEIPVVTHTRGQDGRRHPRRRLPRTNGTEDEKAAPSP